MRPAKAALGIILGLIARVWLSTLRVRVLVDPELLGGADRPWVLSFLHGSQWPLLAWKRRRPTVVLVSLSGDGCMQARALSLQGFSVVRGSSSRGGVRGLATLVRRMRCDGSDAAFAVDGPRGPQGIVKGGAILAARATRASLVPMGGAIASGIVLAKAWDRFGIAWPFSRVVVALGAPVDPMLPDARVRLERAIREANDRAACAV